MSNTYGSITAGKLTVKPMPINYKILLFKVLDKLTIGQSYAIKSVNGLYDFGTDTKWDIELCTELCTFGGCAGMYKVGACYYFPDEVREVTL